MCVWTRKTKAILRQQPTYTCRRLTYPRLADKARREKWKNEIQENVSLNIIFFPHSLVISKNKENDRKLPDYHTDACSRVLACAGRSEQGASSRVVPGEALLCAAGSGVLSDLVWRKKEFRLYFWYIKFLYTQCNRSIATCSWFPSLQWV